MIEEFLEFIYEKSKEDFIYSKENGLKYAWTALGDIVNEIEELAKYTYIINMNEEYKGNIIIRTLTEQIELLRLDSDINYGYTNMMTSCYDHSIKLFKSITTVGDIK